MKSFSYRFIYGLVAALALSVLTVTWVRTRVIQPTPDAARVLRSAATAGDRVTYAAEVRSTSVHRGQTLSVKSRVSHIQGAQRVEYVTGPMPGLVVISRQSETYTVKPKSNTAIVASSSKNETESMELLLKNHSAVVTGSATVAGRRCHVVNVLPKDANGASRRLYIDKNTHLVLRNDYRTSTGKLRTSSEITRIDYSPSFPDSAFRTAPGTKMSRLTTSGVLSPEELSRKLGFQVTLPKYVPSGYVADAHQIHKCNCPCGHESAHLSYTNGLTTISIFQTNRLSHCGSSLCELRPGASADNGCTISDSGRGKAAILERTDRAIIVVGELRDSELRKIAESVTR